ncbi:MAG: DmsC/YnfH family molybdoenzyme membrane anchor subunit [Beijerinckiaceae bacterium]|mgnify:CR=1 FL=1
MSGAGPFLDRVPPRLQSHWDIRGALNFMLGGAGAGLLAAIALATPIAPDVRALVALGLALVGAGLFCVWLKIGRPWRAFHVIRRPSTSWMSREAWIAPLIFACGAYAIVFQARLAVLACSLLGLVYAYAQARILKANIGIPAWRRWSCVSLVFNTALTEGLALLCMAALVWPQFATYGYPLAALLVLRFAAWRFYLDDLRRTGAPTGTLAAFDAFGPKFVWIGHVAAGVCAAAGTWSGQAILVAAGGLLALIGGALFKYTLVCRAAFTQGFALPRSPSRGKGKPGAGAQPGWQAGKAS